METVAAHVADAQAARMGAARFAMRQGQSEVGCTVEFPFGYLKKMKRPVHSYRDEWNDWYWNRDPYIIEYFIDSRGARELGRLESASVPLKQKRGRRRPSR